MTELGEASVVAPAASLPLPAAGRGPTTEQLPASDPLLPIAAKAPDQGPSSEEPTQQERSRSPDTLPHAPAAMPTVAYDKDNLPEGASSDDEATLMKATVPTPFLPAPLPRMTSAPALVAPPTSGRPLAPSSSHGLSGSGEYARVSGVRSPPPRARSSNTAFVVVAAVVVLACSAAGLGVAAMKSRSKTAAAALVAPPPPAVSMSAIAIVTSTPQDDPPPPAVTPTTPAPQPPPPAAKPRRAAAPPSPPVLIQAPAPAAPTSADPP